MISPKKYFFSWTQYRELLRELLTPNEICENPEDIHAEDLYRKGFRTIMLDIDNTIMKYTERDISLQKVAWVDSLKATGFRIFILSNNSSKHRIQRVANQLQLEGAYFSQKPLPFGFRELALKHHIFPSRTIVIGDQLLTDVIIGNWIGAHSILVDPLDKRVSFIKTMQRELELFVLRKLDAYPF
ncbi:YqeG family HAD IIIA-type phosphatase [bacterium]|jgi:uncharacterized protein|nr:YqeG family HAD IIIA-type phosphatase [bacterium]